MFKILEKKSEIDAFLSTEQSNKQFEILFENITIWGGSLPLTDPSGWIIDPCFFNSIYRQIPTSCFLLRIASAGLNGNAVIQSVPDNNTIAVNSKLIRSIKIAIEEPTQHLAQNQGENQMSKTQGLFSGMKDIATEGVKLAIGNRVATIIKNRITKALKKAKVPEAIVDHQLAQAILMIAGPNILRLVLQLIPSIKVNDKIHMLLDAASVASVASVSTDVLIQVESFLKPMLKELGSIDVQALDCEKPKLP